MKKYTKLYRAHYNSTKMLLVLNELEKKKTWSHKDIEEARELIERLPSEINELCREVSHQINRKETTLEHHELFSQVRQLYASGVPICQIAKDEGINLPTASAILRYS